MDKDIVCEREVPTTTPYVTKHGDRTFYFCSKKCEMDFVGNPTKYIEKVGGAIGSTEGSPKINAQGKTTSSRT